MKNNQKGNSYDLDMSICRKINQKSPSPPHQNRSHSSSRRKVTSQTKEISTQTKPKIN